MNAIRFMLQLFILYYALVATNAYDFTTESNLRTLLWTTNGYQLMSRPDATVDVNVSFIAMSLNDLDVKSQSMSLNGYFSFKWSDSRLVWSTNPTYSMIDNIFSTSVYTWRPTLIVGNAIDGASIIEDEDNMMRITSSGTVIWDQLFQTATSCNTDITFYPFDTQSCSIDLTTWSYTANEVSLLFETDMAAISMDFFLENGEWEYISYATEIETVTRGPSEFKTAKIDMTFRRRPAFMVMNIILPVIALAMLICLVFKVPEGKIGYSLTVMLAYAVYLTLVSGHMPSTSVQTSVLGLYNLIVLFLGILSVPITIFTLTCNHEKLDVDVVPEMICNITSCFERFIRCPGCCGKRNDKVSVILVEEHDKKKSVKPDDGNENQEKFGTYEWKDVGKIWDKFFFKLYWIVEVSITIILMIVMLLGYFTRYTEQH